MRDIDTGGEYEEHYDRLALCPGASAVRPNIPGIDLPQVHVLRRIGDMDKVKALVDGSDVDAPIQHAVIVGAGYIGLETAEKFHYRGIAVDVVEMTDRIVPPLDRELTTGLENYLRGERIGLHLNTAAASSSETPGGRISVGLQNGSTLDDRPHENLVGRSAVSQRGRSEGRPEYGGAYSYRGEFAVDYAPELDDQPDPGEIVWAWVPYQEDESIGKDRPVLVVGLATDAQGDYVGLMLSTRDHRGDQGWVSLGDGAWDSDRRESWVKTDRLLGIPETGIRREGAALQHGRFMEILDKARREQSGEQVD